MRFESEPPTDQPVDCAADPTGSLVTMFVDLVQKGRIDRGQRPARRPVFLKQHGATRATLRVRPDLPERLRVGILRPGATYGAWLRFSSDTVPTQADYRTTVGIGMKLFGVPGRKLFGDPAATTFDLVFQNMDRFFVDTATDMCAFTKAGVVDGDYGPYLEEHPRTRTILEQMAQPVGSVLGISYWAILPFHLGPDRYVKYRLDPAVPIAPPRQAPADPDYLAADLHERLMAGPSRFTLSVQERTDPATMPLDKATEVWESPFVPVADVVIERQDVSAPASIDYGENLSCNIFRVTAEHAPAAQSSIAGARQVVYANSAELRHEVNDVPDDESENPPPADQVAPSDTRIVRAAIHPAIGVARVGDSESGYFLGPEVPQAPAREPGFYRDSDHALKRQAARFRIYGYNAAGEVVRELTAADAEIHWQVEVANRKAAWYDFVTALDLPETADLQVGRRNPKITGPARAGLAITPAAARVSGVAVTGPTLTGRFKNVPVALGQLRTDEQGRLVFLGGHGRSGSPSGAPPFDPTEPDGFNNATDWYDDTSDGPVDAAVRLDGRTLPVEGAWVIVAPPDFAPEVTGWRTLYDLLVDLYLQNGWLPLPTETSFTRDVLPALQRLSNLQWVNAGFQALFGKGRPFDFTSPELIGRLATPPGEDGSDPYAELRRRVTHAFRPTDTEVNEPRIWPWIYGDHFGGDLLADRSPRAMLALPAILQWHLDQWVSGQFLGDWNPEAAPVTDLGQVPVADQPATLDRAALERCLADAFHPGCELTWPVRHLSMYSAPFRIRRRPRDRGERDYGNHLDAGTALSVDGPLYAQGPGDLTRWMALPWQGDTAYCRSGYDPQFDPYLPTFWPARVPNQVLTEADYAVVVDTSRPREERLAAYNRRASWFRFIDEAGGTTAERMQRMVTHFAAQGILEPRPGVPDDPDFPAELLVESVPSTMRLLAAGLVGATAPTPDAVTHRERLVQLAGWGDEDHLAEARRLRSRRR